MIELPVAITGPLTIELRVELSDAELNFALAQWAAAQPGASETLKRLVAEGADVDLRLCALRKSGVLRLEGAGPC